MNNFFEWVVPERWRKRKPMPADRVAAVMGTVPDGDPALAAMMELLRDQFAAEAELALTVDFSVKPMMTKGGEQLYVPTNSAEGRAYQCGRAAGIYALMARIENAREEAREEAAARVKEAVKQK